MSAEEVAFQQEVIHEGHEQQQRRKAASNEGHKIGHLSQTWRGELLQVLLCGLVTGVQPAPKMNISKSGMALLQVLLCSLVTGVQPVPYKAAGSPQILNAVSLLSRGGCHVMVTHRHRA